jgi:hypothetical protein
MRWLALTTSVFAHPEVERFCYSCATLASSW